MKQLDLNRIPARMLSSIRAMAREIICWELPKKGSVKSNSECHGPHDGPEKSRGIPLENDRWTGWTWDFHGISGWFHDKCDGFSKDWLEGTSEHLQETSTFFACVIMAGFPVKCFSAMQKTRRFRDLNIHHLAICYIAKENGWKYGPLIVDLPIEGDFP